MNSLGRGNDKKDQKQAAQNPSRGNGFLSDDERHAKINQQNIEPGAYVVFSLLTLLSIFLILMLTPLKARLKGLRGARSMRRVKTEGKRGYPAPVGFDDCFVGS